MAPSAALELRAGCHLSLGRKPRLSIQEAHSHGARALQVFASSPAAWKPPRLAPEWVVEVRSALDEFAIEPLVIHAIYLINLASANPELVRRSIHSLMQTLDAAEQLGARIVVTHVGSHGGRGFDAVREQVAHCLLTVLGTSSGGVTLALENAAGSGATLGATCQELESLIQATGGHPRLGVALDTAHLCGAGWELSAPGEAERLCRVVTRTIGMTRLVTIHANDSRLPCGSRRDRHATIGEGTIGIEGFRALLAQPPLRSVPWILETPDLDPALPAGERMGSLDRLLHLAREPVETGAPA